ncbi:MAG: 2-oxo acid dehydrogenase subunit E2, partial [Planctomycetales bacterium]|nr:2-oxo acid dehydrogenase subunit E2 [Planctomycetales bacterium]
VKEGDVISKEQGILELETDKATMEVPSSHAGKVTKVHVSEGQSVEIGATLLTLESADAGETDAAPEKPSAEAKKPEPEKKPESDKKPESSPPKQVEGPADEEVSTAASKESDSEQASAPTKQPSPQPAAKKAAEPKKSAPQLEPTTSADGGDAAGDDNGAIAAGPSIRRFAREVGVDLRNVSGSGDGGRITRDDVLHVVRAANQSATKPAKKGKSTAAASSESDNWGPIRTEKMTKIRKTIARKMHESWSTVPRVTNFDDADVTELESFRQASKDDYAQRGIKLTTMPFVIKAVAMALKQNPALNATIDMENDQIVYKDYVNIGIAVDSERGLVVPSLRGVGELSIPEIASDLAKLAENVRSGSFSVEDLRGSTFTISNLGAIGGTYSTPIINVPEVAILLLGRTRKLPVVVNDQIVPRLMMPLSLSYDHRLVDGATAARFLNDLIGYLRAPSRLLLAP